MKPLVDTGLFFFGLANAGVLWWGRSSWDQNSWAVFLGLGLGKTIGIAGAVVLAVTILKRLRHHAALPVNAKTGEQLVWRDMPMVGLLGATGFTVALFVAEAAGGNGSLRLGAIASFVYLLFAVAAGKIVARKNAPPA